MFNRERKCNTEGNPLIRDIKRRHEESLRRGALLKLTAPEAQVLGLTADWVRVHMAQRKH